ncbi:MAG: tetratricopeptide repeat protein, partial [Wenzhouxiangella sp.]|nr:tetratricopeptide repeat protein [Wenzhouxiangella sp.]
HRIASGALALALCSVVVGTSLVLRFAAQAELDRQRAVAEANKARASTEFLADLFSGSTPGRSQGPETTARELLERGRERMNEELADHPETRAYLEWVIARSFMFLGLYDEALALIETPAPSASLSLANDRHLLKARLLAFKGQFLEVLEHLETLELDRLEPLQRAQAELSRSTALVNLGDTAAARQAADQVLHWAGRAEDGLEMRASAQNMLAVIAYNEGDLDRARADLENLLATRIRQYGQSHAETALVIHNLAGVSYALGDLNSALEQYERSAVLFEQHYGVENRSFAMVQRALGMTLRKLGDADRALERFERTLGVIEAWSGSDNPLWREVQMQKIELLVLMGRDAEATDALAAFGPLDPDHWEGRQGEACRWARLRAAMALPEDTSRWCDGLGVEPDNLRPGQDYLRALIARTAGTPDFESHRARAIESIDLISPPDPLLVAAIRQL